METELKCITLPEAVPDGDELRRFLYNMYIHVPDDFDWSPVTKDGKVTKRFKKWLKKWLTDADIPKQLYFPTYWSSWDFTDTTSTNKWVEYVGGMVGDEYARNHVPKRNVWVRLTDDFGWQSGNFGDDGSCFWGGQWSAKELIRGEDGHALQVFMGKDDMLKPYRALEEQATDGTELWGAGRCWAVPMGDKSSWVVFNDYCQDGIRPQLHLKEFAKFFGEVMGWESYHTRKIDLTAGDEDSGVLYINGGKGIAVTRDTKYSWGSYDIPVSSCTCCDECGDGIDEHDAYTVNDRTLCPDCYHEHYTWCNRCNDDVHRDYAVYNEDGDAYCEYCYDRTYTRCNECQCEVEHGDTTFVDEWVGRRVYGDYCQECYEDIQERMEAEAEVVEVEVELE